MSKLCNSEFHCNCIDFVFTINNGRACISLWTITIFTFLQLPLETNSILDLYDCFILVHSIVPDFPVFQHYRYYHTTMNGVSQTVMTT